MTRAVDSISLASEFAAVRVFRDESANGPRLVIEDLRTGRSIALDPLELEWIAWSTHAVVRQLLSEALQRVRLRARRAGKEMTCEYGVGQLDGPAGRIGIILYDIGKGVGMNPTSPVAIDTSAIPWESTAIPGLAEKVLWAHPETGASVTLLKFDAGAGIDREHTHPSNQFMYCLSGSYLDSGSGIVSTPGTFYWNPTEVPHGPTEALEECVLLEIYDGPHYA